MNPCLINASNPINISVEWDEYVDYRDGYEACFSGSQILKKCRSWHSIPAVFGTEFFVYNKGKWQGVFKYDKIIVLVNRDLQAVIPLVQKLKSMNKKVLVGFHESYQDFSHQCMNPNWILQLKQLVNMSDGYLNICNQARDFFSEIFKPNKVISIFHANPYDELDLSYLKTPFEKREGIMVPTRTFNQRLSRNTLFSLTVANIVARNFDTFVTFVNEDPWDGQELVNLLGLERVKVIQGSQKYEDWLELLGRHRLLWQYDESHTLGQVVSDAVLVDNYVYGGNTDHNVINCESVESMDLVVEKVGHLYQFIDKDQWHGEGSEFKFNQHIVKIYTEPKMARAKVMEGFL